MSKHTQEHYQADKAIGLLLGNKEYTSESVILEPSDILDEMFNTEDMTYSELNEMLVTLILNKDKEDVEQVRDELYKMYHRATENMVDTMILKGVL